MLVVHHLQRSQSERVVFCCEELGIPYELKLYQRAPLACPPEYASLHPLQASPVIVDEANGNQHPIVLAESAAILEYLARVHGGGRLILAPDHPNYADYLYWFHFANGSFQPALVRSMYFSFLGMNADSPWQQHIDEKLSTALKAIDGRLGTAKYLAGDEITLADIMTVFSLSTMRVFIPFDLKHYPGIARYLKEVGARPAYKRAMEKAEPDLTPALDEAPPLRFAAIA